VRNNLPLNQALGSPSGVPFVMGNIRNPRRIKDLRAARVFTYFGDGPILWEDFLEGRTHGNDPRVTQG
jgi:hypothetical protein